MSNNDEVAGRIGADMVRAVAQLRVAVRAVDRLVGCCRSSTAHPELSMALIESSHAAQRALVTLAEARQQLADPFPLRPQDAVTQGTTATVTFRREDD